MVESGVGSVRSKEGFGECGWLRICCVKKEVLVVYNVGLVFSSADMKTSQDKPRIHRGEYDVVVRTDDDAGLVRWLTW